MNRYEVNPVVSLREEVDGVLLFNPDNDEVILVNETGRLIWGFISQPRTITEITAYLATNTALAENVPATDTARIEADSTVFIESLLPDFVVEHD